MAKFEVTARRLHTYTIVIEAQDENQVEEILKDMISDDFEPFETNAQWDIDIQETDDNAKVNFIEQA